jgi:hypothetical protein
MLYESLKYVSAISILVPFIIGIFRLRVFNFSLKTLFLLVIIALITEIVCYLHFLKASSTIPIFFIYTIFEGFILLFFYSIVFESSISKSFIKISIVCYLILAALSFILNWSHEILNASEGFLLLLLSSMCFYNMLNLEKVFQPISSNYLFWINSGIFLYFGINLFLLLFENTIRNSNPFIRNFSWSIHLFINIVFNSLLAIGFWKKKHK